MAIREPPPVHLNTKQMYCSPTSGRAQKTAPAAFQAAWRLD